MRTILFRYNPWWEYNFELSNINLIDRSLCSKLINNELQNNQVVFITGLRRVGKTSILKLLIKKIIEKGISEAENILYISLDDYLLLNNSIIEIVEEFRKINNLKFEEKIFLFLDEITFKEDYQIQLKNLFDNHNVKIFASSSSASILKSNLSFLTGRHYTYELLPLDFEEYLLFKDLKFSESDTHLYEKYFHDYLTTGGIPAFVLNNKPDYLNQLVDDIIYKDIAAIHNIKNIKLLKEFFLILMERSGKQISINKIAKILSMSPDTSRRYLELFTDTFLVHTVNRHGKTNEKILSPKKIYAADLGIRAFYTGKRDYGSLFENYVFLKLKDLSPEYIYQDSIEIDFTIENKIIECKYHNESLNEKQQKLFDKLNMKEKYIFRTNLDIKHYFQ